MLAQVYAQSYNAPLMSMSAAHRTPQTRMSPTSCANEAEQQGNHDVSHSKGSDTLKTRTENSPAPRVLHTRV